MLTSYFDDHLTNEFVWLVGGFKGAAKLTTLETMGDQPIRIDCASRKQIKRLGEIMIWNSV